MENISTLEITRDNILNWLNFILKIVPLPPEEYYKLKRYLRRRDKFHMNRELDELFS